MQNMLSWARSVTDGSGEHDLLELYCGNGNFTVALAPNFRQARVACGLRLLLVVVLLLLPPFFSVSACSMR